MKHSAKGVGRNVSKDKRSVTRKNTFIKMICDQNKENVLKFVTVVNNRIKLTFHIY